MKHSFADMIKKAGNRVKVGAVYHHYRDPVKYYRVERLAIDAVEEKVVVIYCSYNNHEQMTWVRSLESWLEIVDGEPRFSRVE